MTINGFIDYLTAARAQHKARAYSDMGCFRIRAEDGQEHCPITFAAYHASGITFSPGNFIKAAELIGLTNPDAGDIARSADADSVHSSAELRERIRVACGLQLANA